MRLVLYANWRLMRGEPERRRGFSRVGTQVGSGLLNQIQDLLRAAQRAAAVQALIATAIANGNAAAGANGRVAHEGRHMLGKGLGRGESRITVEANINSGVFHNHGCDRHGGFGFAAVTVSIAVAVVMFGAVRFCGSHIL